ncbi:MAG: type II toxin-antitoxin system VapC family toxin, partial [Thiohalomonadales bacterium]
MILIDTNIISEIMKRSPTKSVLNWINKQDTLSLYISTITLAEIRYGLRIMPQGQRKDNLSDHFSLFIAKAFEQRILSFNEDAAVNYAEIMGHRKETGKPMSVPDGQIAAIARSNNFKIATRNIRDFDECGLT